MFYDDKLCGKDKKVKEATAAVAVIIFLLWLILTIRVNIVFPGKTIEQCSYGEWTDYKPDIKGVINADVSLSPVSCKMYDYEELKKIYLKEESIGGLDARSNAQYLVFTINIKNNGKEDVNINRLSTLFRYCTPFNGDWNSLEKIDKNNVSVSPGETRETEFVTNVRVYDDIGYKCKERFSENEVFVIFSQYPVEKRLVFNID